MAAASNADERCEADFYIGEWHLIHGRRDEAIPAFRSAVDYCPKDFIEYFAAAAELERIEE